MVFFAAQRSLNATKGPTQPHVARLSHATSESRLQDQSATCLQSWLIVWPHQVRNKQWVGSPDCIGKTGKFGCRGHTNENLQTPTLELSRRVSFTSPPRARACSPDGARDSWQPRRPRNSAGGVSPSEMGFRRENDRGTGESPGGLLWKRPPWDEPWDGLRESASRAGKRPPFPCHGTWFGRNDSCRRRLGGASRKYRRTIDCARSAG